MVGSINGHSVWTIIETEIIPFRRTDLHLNEKQKWYNKHFTDMIHLVLSTGGFYFSHSFDLSHTLQWLADNATPTFRARPMIERSDERFVWNRYLADPLSHVPGAYRYVPPLIHGFFATRRCIIGQNIFNLILISRRSIYRAGMRYHVRGVSSNGHSANFVETEQIIEYDKDGDSRRQHLCSFVQTRGSIPLFWSQKPNLRWQPDPIIKPADDQLSAYIEHMKTQQALYGGKHIIVNLINQQGRERRLGGELERVVLRANLDFVRYNPFDFHKECNQMNWERLSILKNQLRDELTHFGFFISTLSEPENTKRQLGFFRTNCLDCLDRTNVVQAMLAKESLKDQLTYLKILNGALSIDDYSELNSIIKNGLDCF